MAVSSACIVVLALAAGLSQASRTKGAEVLTEEIKEAEVLTEEFKEAEFLDDCGKSDASRSLCDAPQHL